MGLGPVTLVFIRLAQQVLSPAEISLSGPIFVVLGTGSHAVQIDLELII